MEVPNRVMFLKDSGLRISDVVRVKWEDKVDMGDGFWNFNLLTKKKRVQACAFVGPDTTRLLEQFKTKTDRIFRTGADNMNDKVNNLIRKAGIEGLTAHGLRKFFVTSMQHARVPEQYYLHMMGKKSSVYSEKRRSMLFEAYKKAYSELSVYTQKQRNMEVLRDIEVLKKENQELKKQIETMYGYIEEKLVPLMSVAVCQLERNPELRTKLEKKGYRMKLFLETEKEAREEMLKKKRNGAKS